MSKSKSRPRSSALGRKMRSQQPASPVPSGVSSAKSAEKDLLPLRNNYEATLEDAKLCIEDTIQWLIDSGYQYPDVLRHYRDALEAAAPANEHAPEGASVISRIRKERENKAAGIRLDTEYISQMARKMRAVGSVDYFVQDLAAAVAREAWGLKWVESCPSDEEERRARIPDRVFVDAGGNMDETQVQEFVLSHRDDVVELAWYTFLDKFFEAVKEAEALRWAVANGLCSVGRTDKEPQAGGRDRVAARRARLLMDSKGDETLLLAGEIGELLRNTFLEVLRAREEHEAVQFKCKEDLLVFYFGIVMIVEGWLDFEAFAKEINGPGAADDKDPATIQSYFIPVAKQLLPPMQKAVKAFETRSGIQDSAKPEAAGAAGIDISPEAHEAATREFRTLFADEPVTESRMIPAGRQNVPATRFVNFLLIGNQLFIDQEFWKNLPARDRGRLWRSDLLKNSFAMAKMGVHEAKKTFFYGTRHTELSLAMMMANAGLFPGQTVADAGAGDGILGTMALKMGAKKVFFIENNETTAGWARHVLAWNISDVTSYQILNRDIADVPAWKHEIAPVDTVLSSLEDNGFFTNPAVAGGRPESNNHHTLLLQQLGPRYYFLLGVNRGGPVEPYFQALLRHFEQDNVRLLSFSSESWEDGKQYQAMLFGQAR